MADIDEALSQLGRQSHENAVPTDGDATANAQPTPCNTNPHNELTWHGAIAQGSGSVAVAGDVHGPIHTGSGDNVQNITQYVTNPLPIGNVLRDIGTLLLRNRLLIILTLAFQIPLAALFFAFRDRLLLSDWTYVLVAILMAVATWRWLKLTHERRIGRSFLLVGLITAGWVGLLGHQTWKAIHPARFSDEQFGIAVATFGEGANNTSSALGREITHQLVGGLEEAINQGTRDVVALDVATRRIGLVQNEIQATEEGKRVGAELVLWGKVLEEKTGSEIHFQVLEAPDITDNPDFPHTLLVEANMRSQVVFTSTNPVEVRKAVSAQNAAVVRYSLGLYYYLNLDFGSAVDQFERALGFAAPVTGTTALIDAAIVHYYLGKSYQFLERYEKAESALAEAARLNPKEPAIALAQAYNYRVMGLEVQRQQAIQHAIDLCNELPPNLLPAIYDRALAYEQQDNLEAALREYEAILRVQPDFFIAYLGSARLLARLGRFEEAMARYQQAQPLIEGQIRKQVWLNLDMGSLYAQQDKAENALVMYSRAIALDPALSMPHYLRAQLYEKLGMSDDALQDYRTLAEVSTQPHWAHETYAEYLRRTKNYPESIEQHLEALRYPVHNDAITHTRLGMAYAASNEQDFPRKEQQAQAAFEQALLSPGPNEPYIRREYGLVLEGFGRTVEAIEQFERSLQLDGYTDPATMLNLGQLYESEGNPTAAIDMYEKVLTQEGQISDDLIQKALERLANLLEMEGLYDEEQSPP